MTAHLDRRQIALNDALLEFTKQVEHYQQLQRVEAEARRARHEWRKAEQELADMEDRKEAVAEQLDQFRRAAASAQAELEVKTENYRKATGMLKTYMGIEVLKDSKKATEPGAVSRVITLTRVVESDPERPFHVRFMFSGTKVTLGTTKPSLGDISDIQTELDESGNLALCMVRLRSRFQALARQQAEKRERRAAAKAASAAAPAAPAAAPARV
ncbi:uncharacterized protein LOC122385424 isoform X2 [Amphibalanus amphitrite]|nr:uncharacterized protein LOC122385424 isoform X2 [Amphibalanus amphitrite]